MSLKTKLDLIGLADMKAAVDAVRLAGVNRAILLGFIMGAAAGVQGQQSLGLEQAISQAWQNDDWLLASEQREQALLQESAAVAQLPDPRMSIGFANLPLDTLRFRQEPMTQFRIGINQTFPRGDTLELQRRQKLRLSEINPFQREERRAKVKLQVSQRWLDSYLAQESIALINGERDLFEQLAIIADTRYRTAEGAARQQDLIRAELELTRLDERLSALRQGLESSKRQLAQWLPYELLNLPLEPTLPALGPAVLELENLAQAVKAFSDHPQVKALDKQIDAALTGVELARQSYKPAFALGANYGFRDHAPTGVNRADFISLELSFDLPMLAEKRHKPKVEAASYAAAASQTERALLFKSLFASYQQARAQLAVLEERQVLFEETLLPQMSDLTAAALAAYTADEGDFEEVTRAYIAELNAKIDLLGIAVEKQKLLATLDYLLTGSAPQAASSR